MSQQELLKQVVGVLEEEGIPYMVTGSTVSSLQGTPRSTHDIDIVVAIEAKMISALTKAFALPRFYLEEGAILDAIKHCSMFNLIDSEGGDKVDFWILTSDAFRQSMFNRRYSQQAAGTGFYVSQPEDTILNKFLWARESGGSEKQFEDCRAVYEVNYTHLDHDYLDRWARELGVEEMLVRLRKVAEV